MANALSILDDVPQLPDSYDQYFGSGNIAERVTVPSVTFSGKVWTINYNGEKTRLVKRDEEGEETPLSVMKVVILDYNKSRGRAYYEGEYDPDKPGAPVCWSDDGKVPHESVKEPLCGTCSKCPMAAKGSKITPQGKEVKACAEYRMLVVVPANGLGQFPPLRMKISVTSDYDARSPELAAQGWFAFHQYTELLRTRNVKHSGRLVTKMKFDPNAAYPKLLFSVDRWLENSELAIVGPLAMSEDTKALLGGAFTPAGADGKRTSTVEAPKPALKSAPVEDDEDETPPKPAKKAKVEAAPKVVKKAPPPPADDEDEEAAPKAAKPKSIVMDDDEDDEPKPAKKAKGGAEPVKPAAVAEGLSELLDEWGDE